MSRKLQTRPTTSSPSRCGRESRSNTRPSLNSRRSWLEASGVAYNSRILSRNFAGSSSSSATIDNATALSPAASTSVGRRHISTKRPFQLTMCPWRSTTRIASAVDSNVAVNNEFEPRSSSSVAIRSAMSTPAAMTPSTVGSSSRFVNVNAMGMVVPSKRGQRTSIVRVAPAVLPFAKSRRTAAIVSRSSSATSAVSGRPSICSWSWPSRRVSPPEDAMTIPCPSRSSVTAAAYCTNARKRAVSSPAISQRRRSVMSRMHNTISFAEGAPRISASRHSPFARTRTSINEPASFCCTLATAWATSSKSSGWTRSIAFMPTASVSGTPKKRSAARFPQSTSPPPEITTTGSGKESATADARRADASGGTSSSGMATPSTLVSSALSERWFTAMGDEWIG